MPLLDGFVPWPAETAERYRADGTWAGEPLGELLRSQAARTPDNVALIDGDRSFTYAALDRWADRLAAGFSAAGLRAGDRAVLQLPNVAEHVAVSFAFFRIGVLPVFTLPNHRMAELDHICGLTGASAYVTLDRFLGFDHRGLARSLRERHASLRHVFVVGDPGEFAPLPEAETPLDPAGAPGPDASDVAFFLLSGGTTALPKLIPRTHDDYLYQARTAAGICEYSEDTRYLATLPIAFNFTWGCPGVVGVFASGGAVVLSTVPDPQVCFPLIARHGVTTTSVVPTIAHSWISAADGRQEELATLELVQVGSAVVHRSLAEEVGPALTARLQQVFGMSEGLLCLTRREDAPETVLTTQGRPISPHDELRVVDAAGDEVAAGGTGELLTRGPYTLRGYYRAEEHNAGAFTPDGFYRTGDLVRITEDGGVVVMGRAKDVIVRGGDKVSAPELEGHLTGHERIDQAAVVPMADAVLGERTCAVIIPVGTPPTLGELRRYLRDRGLASYKFPDRVVCVEAFPKSGLGKVDKKRLVADLGLDAPPGPDAAGSDREPAGAHS
ncbi:(2,3-dihydroxybenzoyl)adenylate synthase [Streptomyces huiliensis]|uniref:(2,3-dihydroxybenzoyl)adenylate synthase n=1 Tax=Streptomyces huiliensis TaxID=2876027 RepID=UPI001CBE41B4|nr:AMP-binding protein [Streptomyces huiliensis]MBZ4320912.1 AMP-binding protein [Streptomyces huiliensis]